MEMQQRSQMTQTERKVKSKQPVSSVWFVSAQRGEHSMYYSTLRVNGVILRTSNKSFATQSHEMESCSRWIVKRHLLSFSPENRADIKWQQ